MTDPRARLRELIKRAEPDASVITELLDGLALPDRITAVRGLGGARLQRRLWEAVAGNPRIAIDELVPREHAPMRPVVFHGKNSLPAFTEFQKICCRPPGERGRDTLWGYNETRIRALIGPGYYVVHDTPGSALGGAAFDYRGVPEQPASGWPGIRDNESGVPRLVYGGMVDYMRRVARDVFIGSATRGGREMKSYFILVRELT